MKRTALGFLSIGLLSACQDRPPSDSPVSPPSFDISEARFGGGNRDFFFAPPLAATPQPGDPGFDAGAASAVQAPYVRICETNGAESPAGCVADVTPGVTGSATGLRMEFSSTGELYHVNWQTKELDPAKDYRIEVWGLSFATAAEKAALDSRWLFGWRDIRHSPNVSSCHGTEEFCLINYGQNVPIKVRIERFVFCPVSRNCAVQFVAAGVNANLEAQLEPGAGASSAQLFIPGQAGTDFALAFEPCSDTEAAAVDAAIDLPTFGPCLKTVTTFSTQLGQPAIVSLCNEVDETTFDLADPVNQLRQLALHHFSEDLSQVQALPEAWQCTAPTSGGVATSGSPNRLLELAAALGHKVLTWVAPRPLAARAVAIDRGGGGESDFVESFFKLALPAKFEYEFPADAMQRGLAGQPFTLRAKVTDLLGGPVKNARVRWTVISSPGADASAPGSPTLSDASGIAAATVGLSSQEGDNLFHAFGRGIADDRESGCSVPTDTNAPCNGPRSAYDPFMSLHSPEFEPGSPGPGDEQVVNLAEGTRLPFTVFGCIQGRGTPTVNGVLGSGEWDCANSQQFPVNLSGGSTVQATFYWMNDDTHFHLAVAVPGAGRENALRIEWDSDGSGAPAGSLEGSQYQGSRALGDDVWEFTPSSRAADKFVDEKCSASSQSSCGPSDTQFGGGQQTVAQFRNDLSGQTVYELSHPLTTGDQRCGGSGKSFVCDHKPIDLDADPGETLGLFVTLRLGSGAQGNTQWPGFLKFLVAIIK